jgi:hypothetical protein
VVEKSPSNTCLPAKEKRTREKARATKSKNNTSKKKRKKTSFCCDSVETFEDDFLRWIASNPADLLSVDEVDPSEGATQGNFESSPPPNDDIANRALSALATVASFLSDAPTAPFSPVVNDDAEVKATDSGIKAEIAISIEPASPAAIKMSVVDDAAHIFVPTPIKLTTFTDISQVFSNDGDDCLMDDLMSTYSLGSLSSPFKLLLPFHERSAFTPIVSSADRLIAGFCGALVSEIFDNGGIVQDYVSTEANIATTD